MDLELTSAPGVAWLEESPFDGDLETRDPSLLSLRDAFPFTSGVCALIH